MDYETVCQVIGQLYLELYQAKKVLEKVAKEQVGKKEDAKKTGRKTEETS